MQFKYILGLAPAALAAVHNVNVGQGGLAFNPKTLSAAVGDKVIFTLFPQHNVAQSSFDKPCANDGGFFSGSWQSASNGAMRFVVTVNDTNPIYYYCSLPTHCQSGMVGGINVPADGNTISDYADGAEKTSNSVVPGGLSGGVLVSEAEASALASSSAAPTPTSSMSVTPSESPSMSMSSSASMSMSMSMSSSAMGSPPYPSTMANNMTSSGSPTGTSPPASSSAAGTTPVTPESTGAAAALQMGSSAVLAAAAGLFAWLL